MSGRPVDSAAQSFTFRGGADGALWTARPTALAFSGFESKMPVGLWAEVKGKVTPLTVLSGFGVFRKGATLDVVMAGKTMALTFDIKFSETSSTKSYLVDGLPFQDGRFEVTLPIGEGQFHFFPTTAWTKK